MTPIRPEAQFLLCCARTSIDEGTAEQIQTLLRQPIDWSYLIQIAVQHRVVPLLYQSLRQTCPDSTPKEILDALQHYYHANAQRNIYLTTKLIKLITWLETQQILAIPYKGPAVAILAYGNVCLRQFGDLDILVQPRDYLPTRDLLLANGYRLRDDFGWECSLVDDISRVCVDLHRGIAPEEFPVHLNFKRLWEHLEPVSIGGGKINTLCPEDMLVILCIQLAKDGSWERPLRLSKVCDIAEILRTHSKLDWGRILKETRKQGCWRMVILGLNVAHESLGAPISAGLLDKSQAHPHIHTLTNHIYHRLFHEVDSSLPTSLLGVRFYLQVRERWRDKLYPYYHAFKLRLIPNEKDRALLPLPASLSFLYYLFRPIRLVRDYARLGLEGLKTRWFTWKNRR